MDERVVALEIAQDLVQAMGRGVHEDDLVACALERKRPRQTQLKRHVETRGLGLTAQIVDRDAAGMQEIGNPTQTPLPRLGNLKHAVRVVAEMYEGTNKGYEERLISLVIGDIEEDRRRILSRSSHRT